MDFVCSDMCLLGRLLKLAFDSYVYSVSIATYVKNEELSTKSE
jgi:hypothetical protein